MDCLITSTDMATYMDANSTIAPDSERETQYLDKHTVQALWEFHANYGAVHGYVSILVCVLGILANIANIVVLNKKHMETSTNILLMWLAVADLCTMVEYTPFALRFYIFRDKTLEFLQTRSYDWICYLLFHANFSITMHSISIWLTIMLAWFRFLYIFFPHRGSIYCSIKHAKLVILTIYLAAVVVCIPNYISNYYRTETKMIEGKNSTVYISSPRRGGGFNVVFDLNYWLQSMLVKLIPCLLLTVLTIMLISALRKAHKRHVHLMSHGKNDDVEKHSEHLRTTGMLLAVVILFLFTELPQGVLTILMIFYKELANELYNPLGDILDIVALLNNAINFVLYCSMSKQFRDTFVDTFCHCFTDDNPRWTKLNLILVRNGKAKEQENGTVV